MKKLIFALLLSFAALSVYAQETEINGCRIISYTGNETYEFSAYGNVYIETNPKKPVDLYVKVVDSPNKASFKIFKTTNDPQKCGEWRFVTDRSKAKFTIRYVKELEDCNIYFVKEKSKAGFY